MWTPYFSQRGARTTRFQAPLECQGEAALASGFATRTRQGGRVLWCPCARRYGLQRITKIEIYWLPSVRATVSPGHGPTLLSSLQGKCQWMVSRRWGWVRWYVRGSPGAGPGTAPPRLPAHQATGESIRPVGLTWGACLDVHSEHISDTQHYIAWSKGRTLVVDLKVLAVLNLVGDQHVVDVGDGRQFDLLGGRFEGEVVVGCAPVLHSQKHHPPVQLIRLVRRDQEPQNRVNKIPLQPSTRKGRGGEAPDRRTRRPPAHHRPA